jgi:hypothetical protein
MLASSRAQRCTVRGDTCPVELLKVLAGKTVRGVGLVGLQALSQRVRAGGDLEPGKGEATTKNPSQRRGANAYYVADRGIVPVFGLALAPYSRSAGCRALHRASALCASRDRYTITLSDQGISCQPKFERLTVPLPASDAPRGSESRARSSPHVGTRPCWPCTW